MASRFTGQDAAPPEVSEPLAHRSYAHHATHCCLWFVQFFLATETQHKVEMDKRYGIFGPQPMAVPPCQQMSQPDQPYRPTVGYPPAYGQYNYPPPAGYHPVGQLAEMILS